MIYVRKCESRTFVRCYVCADLLVAEFKKDLPDLSDKSFR